MFDTDRRSRYVHNDTIMNTRVYLDLDHTLYDTEHIKRRIFSDMVAMGSSSDEVARHSKELVNVGYSFERHLERLGHAPEVVAEKSNVYRAILAEGDAFLYPGVLDGMRRLSKIADCEILTFGVPAFQEEKLRGISSLQPHFKRAHYVYQDTTKGDVIRNAGEHHNTWFVDDSPSHLMDVLEKAPWTRVVRMMWPGSSTAAPHEDDETRWPVVHDFDSFVRRVET